MENELGTTIINIVFPYPPGSWALASTLLKLVRLTCLLADTLKKTLEKELTTTTGGTDLPAS
jgi:hypothetical protein